MQLYNTLSTKGRLELIKNAESKRLTLSFYKYAKIEDPKAFRDSLFIKWNELDVLGRINVAREGINAQLSLPSENFDFFKEHIDSISILKNVRLNIAIEQDNFSFLRLTIKVRDKIVADGLDDETFDVTDCGTHVDAERFNQLMDDPRTLLVDMRNHYESEVGHFKGAITPDVDTFRDSLPLIKDSLEKYKEDKNLLMYCTGGIRCEKASAFFKHNGFKNVFQLEGGIIEYARQVTAKGLENKFVGKNFVFDNRMAERITEDVIAHCHQCGVFCDIHTNCANEACHVLFIQCPKCAEKMKSCCSEDCMKVLDLPEEEQKRLRKGPPRTQKIYRKGRSSVLLFKKPLTQVIEMDSSQNPD